jgi:hypothetical protein
MSSGSHPAAYSGNRWPEADPRAPAAAGQLNLLEAAAAAALS